VQLYILTQPVLLEHPTVAIHILSIQPTQSVRLQLVAVVLEPSLEQFMLFLKTKKASTPSISSPP
jgi:hypothetical protein